MLLNLFSLSVCRYQMLHILIGLRYLRDALDELCERAWTHQVDKWRPAGLNELQIFEAEGGALTFPSFSFHREEAGGFFVVMMFEIAFDARVLSVLIPMLMHMHMVMIN